MRVISNLSDWDATRGVVLTIGAYDGVHCGHQALLRGMVACARQTGLASAVLTFYPHPREVLQPDAELRYITSDAERARLFEQLGVELLVLQGFDRHLAAMDAADYVRRLHGALGVRAIWVGPDFRFGRDRQGSVHTLQELAPQLGFELHVIAAVNHQSERISSTRIRSLLEQGRVAEAAHLLGRQYAMSGVVGHGARRGRRLGFPTANLRVRAMCGCPGDGIYAVWCQVSGQWYAGVANLGRRPSFENGERLLESYLIDYAGSLYGKSLRVLFVDKLRGERYFADPQDLVAQVQADIEAARSLLADQRPQDRTLCKVMDLPS
ncbi:MAG: bifunctional riboflavin kinase/FAD synthetase [Anaerolineae bacterium]|jgi:riboflavin kinase/FMN adenylyltransferase|nr:bifunctional riboflavin kinase/FAD synthetase [Chloroflexota bacterium]